MEEPRIHDSSTVTVMLSSGVLLAESRSSIYTVYLTSIIVNTFVVYKKLDRLDHPKTRHRTLNILSIDCNRVEMHGETLMNQILLTLKYSIL